MILHPPFFISSHLTPALAVGDAILSLAEVIECSTPDGRDRATFILDFPDGTAYLDSEVRSGCQGFKSGVEPFEAFLNFLGACAESVRYGERTGRQGENAGLFPPHIAEWACDNKEDIDMLACALTDPEDRGGVLHHLIED